MRAIFVLAFVLVYCAEFSLCNEESDQASYSNSWAVHVGDLDQDAVTQIATKYGFTNRGQIGKLHGYYLFEKNKAHLKHSRRRRSAEEEEDHRELLMSEPKIHWVKQQRILERSKRNVISDESHESRNGRDMAVSVQDPYYKDQWYLQNIGQSSGPSGLDINVLPVWGRGYTGQGVVVSILDDGVDHTHPDLRKNYDPSASFDFNDFDPDPTPRSTDPLNCHGTRCAGEVAAEANNGICGVGVSFNASVGGIRMLDGVATDVIESLSLGYRSDYIDIYTSCWGPKDDGKRFGKPGFLASKSLKIGAEKGRGGKGNIFVWATGNGGLTDDDCNCDGYTTSIYTISIGAISDHGLSTYYTETCASTIAVTFSGASHREADENKIVTTDLNHQCTETFKGTSSAAPLAAGMLALVLEANPHLTWRDVQHIIVETSQKTSAFDEGWKTNGAGKQFNHKFGFGKMDAMKMVDAALKWKLVPKQRVCHDTKYDTKRNIPSSGSLILSANTQSCADTTSEVRKLEHVQVVVTLKHRRRGDLSFDLISPSGTRSRLLKTRRNDKSTEGLTDWVFMTVHFWGENPKGSWSLVITDNDRNTREHHVTKAKQGDMEDVQRVFMDDSEKRGNWDASVINEYERRNQTSPRNTTMHDHILKSIEDTTGELVKGNKFTELAKRLKNRRKKLPKVNYFHAMHARKANKIPKKPTTVKSSKNPSQKHLKHWHNTAKHKSHHKGSHHKHRDHHKTAHHHKVHKKRTHPAAKHSNDVLKAKKGTKHSKQNKKKLNQENYGNDDSKLSTINSKGTGIDHKHAHNEEEDSESPMAEGSIEIPPGSPAEAKLALQALANPLIQKIIGLSRTARFFPKTLHNTLAGEVDVNMKVLDNGYKKALNTKAQTKKLSSLEKKAQHKHVKAKLSTKSDDNVYANILKSINGLTGKNTKEKLLNQVNIIHDNLTDSEQSLTGTNAKESVITGKESKSSKLSENDFTKTKSQSKYSTAIKRPLVGSISTDESTNESAQGENHSNGSDYTGRALTGKAHQSGSAKNLEKVDDKENSEKVDSAPLIFFDDDSKRYVAVSKVEPNNTSTPLVVAEEGTGSGNHEMNTTEGHGEEGSGIPIGETADCEETGSDGECLNNDDNEYLKENFENGDDDSNIRKNVHNKHKKKEPKDDFGAVGFDGYDGSKKQTTGSKLLADNNVPLSDFKPNGVGMPDNTDLTGSENAHSKGNENAQSTGSEDVHSTGSEDAQSTRSETAQSTGSENAHPTGSEDAQSTGSENAHSTGGAIGESESDDGMYPLDRTIHENKLGNETMSNKYTTGSSESPITGSRAKLQTGSNLEERKPVKSNYHPSIEDKTGSKLMTLNDYTGYQNDQPETNVTVNTDGHTNGEIGELKDQRNVFQDSENKDYGNTTQLRPKTMESSSVNSPINKVENNKFNHDNQNNAFMWHENAGYLNNENDTTETKTYDHSKDYGIHNDQLKLNVIDNQADEKYMQRHFENDDVDTRNTKIHETATAKNKTNEPQLKDDFGLVGGDKHRFTNEVRTHEHDTSYSAFKNETFDKYDREAMKSRLEAEYGRVDSSLTKEDFDTMRYNSLAAQLKDRGRVLPNEEFFEKPIGSDIPGSENDTNSQGYKKGGNFFDHYIGEAITGQSDSIEGSVNDDINDDLLDSSAEEYHPSYVQSKIVTSGDDREISRNYMIDNQNSTEGQSQVIEKSLSDKKLQTLNRKLHKQQHSNDAPNMKHLNDEMVPSVALFKATIKLNTQNNVPTGAVTDNQHNALKRPVNALPTTHNKAPKGSSFKAALPPASPESPSPIIVKAIDAAFIAPTPTPKIEMVQKELSQNQPKTPPQEKLAQYAPTNYVPETQAQGQEEGLLDSHKVPVPDDQETPALETNKIPDQLQEMHNNEPDNEDREQRHYLQESEDNTESSPTPSLLRQSKQGESTFLQRVQQDIEQRNVEDLEHLENEVKKEMEKTMNLLTNDPNEQLYRNILTSNDQSEESDDSDSMLYRRSLARGASNDHVPTKQTSMKIEVKQGIDHSGVLESWNLIFYGT